MVFNRPLILSQIMVSILHIAQRIAFSSAIAYFPHNIQLLLKEVHCPLILPQIPVSNPQIAQIIAFSYAIAYFPGNIQLLLKEVDRLLIPSLIPVNNPQIAQSSSRDFVTCDRSTQVAC